MVSVCIEIRVFKLPTESKNSETAKGLKLKNNPANLLSGKITDYFYCVKYIFKIYY